MHMPTWHMHTVPQMLQALSNQVLHAYAHMAHAHCATSRSRSCAYVHTCPCAWPPPSTHTHAHAATPLNDFICICPHAHAQVHFGQLSICICPHAHAQVHFGQLSICICPHAHAQVHFGQLSKELELTPLNDFITANTAALHRYFERLIDVPDLTLREMQLDK